MSRLLRFLKNRDGTIAVEFSFVVPIMLGLFFGLNQLALALGVRTDVVTLASTGADLVAQESTVTTADLSNVFSALAAILYPNDVTPAQITISSVLDNNSGGSLGTNNPTGKVAWSCTKGGTAYAQNYVYTFPTTAQGVITSGSGDSIIVAEVSYSYTLPFAINIPGFKNLAGPYVLTSTFFAKPRRVQVIPGPAAGSCPTFS